MAAERSSKVAILLVLAVFILGAAVGGLGTYLAEARVRAGAASHRQPPDRSPQGLQTERRAQVDRLSKELNLTQDQQAHLDGILSQAQTQYGAIREQSTTQSNQVRKQTREQIRAVLTPDQISKFDDFLHKMDEERKKRMGN